MATFKYSHRDIIKCGALTPLIIIYYEGKLDDQERANEEEPYTVLDFCQRAGDGGQGYRVLHHETSSPIGTSHYLDDISIEQKNGGCKISLVWRWPGNGDITARTTLFYDGHKITVLNKGW